MDEDIQRAIREKRLITFEYDGLHRVAEPHVYGVHGGVPELLVYQVDGQSKTGPIPDWRRVKIGGIENLTLLEKRFPGRREAPSGRHSKWDHVHLVVE